MTPTAIVKPKLNGLPLLFLVGIGGWWIPGLGHLIIGQKSRAAIIFVSIVILFAAGLWIGSIGIIDSSTPWYWAQLLNSPAVTLLLHLNTEVCHIASFGRGREVGQIYTGIAGMLNLLCIVNAVYLAHRKQCPQEQI